MGYNNKNDDSAVQVHDVSRYLGTFIIFIQCPVNYPIKKKKY